MESLQKFMSEAPENIQQSMWKKIVRDCPYYTDKILLNPLTENEVIGLIKDNNLSDNQVLSICKFLRKKWGKETITPKISKKLVKRISLLDQFFTECRLDEKSQYCFKTNSGELLSRSVTYCHDVPGLVAFKKLL